MRGLVIGLSVSVALIIGCATARFVVPPASAQTTTRWRLHCVEAGNWEEGLAQGDALGAEGWEFVSVANAAGNDFLLCFKQPR